MNAQHVRLLLLAVLSLCLDEGLGAEIAHARCYCLSLQFQTGSDAGTGEYSLDLANGELWPYNSSSYAANVAGRVDLIQTDTSRIA